MDFPKLDEATRVARMTPPAGKVRMVLDTDTYNEIDDQFALVYALLAKEKLDLEAVYAAPFHNKRSSGPGDGMEKSYEEILRVLDRMDVSPDGLVYKGSTTYLPKDKTPVESAAVDDLIERSKKGDGPLYVVAIGAITNVASAIVKDPSIIERIVVVWLGGHPLYWPHTREFNLQQDIPAAQVIFDSGVPVVLFPCANCTEMLRTTVAEMEKYVKGRGAIGDYLFEIFENYQPEDEGARYCWSKVIWDIIAVGWLVSSGFADVHMAPSPVLTDNYTWSVDPYRHPILIAERVNRDAIFRDLFRRIEKFSKGEITL